MSDDAWRRGQRDDSEDDDFGPPLFSDDLTSELDDPSDAPLERPSDSDFAARLDLGDDSDLYAAAPARPLSGGDDRRIVQPIFDPEPTGSYTLAGIPPSSELDIGPVIRDRAAPRPTKLPPPSREPVGGRGTAQLPSLYGGAVEDDELEHALGALDVELDDLAIAQAPPTRRATPGQPHATSEDGFEIELDDD